MHLEWKLYSPTPKKYGFQNNSNHFKCPLELIFKSNNSPEIQKSAIKTISMTVRIWCLVPTLPYLLPCCTNSRTHKVRRERLLQHKINIESRFQGEYMQKMFAYQGPEAIQLSSNSSLTNPWRGRNDCLPMIIYTKSNFFCKPDDVTNCRFRVDAFSMPVQWNLCSL